MRPAPRGHHGHTALGRTAFSATVHCLTGRAINALMLAILGAMAAGLGSLAFSLIVAGVVAYPVNYWLISRGRGHAVLNGHHQH